MVRAIKATTFDDNDGDNLTKMKLDGNQCTGVEEVLSAFEGFVGLRLLQNIEFGGYWSKQEIEYSKMDCMIWQNSVLTSCISEHMTPLSPQRQIGIQDSGFYN